MSPSIYVILASVIVSVLGMVIAFGVFLSRRDRKEKPGEASRVKTRLRSQKMIWKLIRWLVVAAVVVYTINYWEPGKLQALIPQSRDVTPQIEYVASFTCLPGETVKGRTESGPKVAEIIKRDDKSLWINVHFTEYGSPEILRVRLKKVGVKVWEGDCDQDNPPYHGRLQQLQEVAPETWIGLLTDKADGQRLLFKICQR